MPQYAHPYPWEHRIPNQGYRSEDAEQNYVQSKDDDRNPIQPVAVIGQIVNEYADDSCPHDNCEP